MKTYFLLFLNSCLFLLHAQDPAVRAPQTVANKLSEYAVVTFGPHALLSPSFSVLRLLLDPPKGYPETWREGTGAMARNYGNAFASRTSLETGRYLTAALLHEDFRYRPSTSKNPFARGLHALAFTFVDRSDDGANRFAAANFIAAGAGGFAGMAYLPGGYGNLSHAEVRMATAFAGLAAKNVLREFAPETSRLKRRFHLPFSGASAGPKWWVKRD